MNTKTVATIAGCLVMLLFLFGCTDNKRELQHTQTVVINDKIGSEKVVENGSIEIPSKNYIGNKNSQVLHVPACDSLPAGHNRLYFETIDEALTQGYRKHYECMGN